jgi:hypothetical protein
MKMKIQNWVDSFVLVVCVFGVAQAAGIGLRVKRQQAAPAGNEEKISSKLTFFHIKP